ncbi:hypothetical protein ACFLQ9_00485 [Bacteroidota bacterium]
MKRKELKKKNYTKPRVEKIKIDKNISMVMTSPPPGDPPVLPPIIPDGSIFK